MENVEVEGAGSCQSESGEQAEGGGRREDLRHVMRREANKKDPQERQRIRVSGIEVSSQTCTTNDSFQNSTTERKEGWQRNWKKRERNLKLKWIHLKPSQSFLPLCSSQQSICFSLRDDVVCQIQLFQLVFFVHWRKESIPYSFT